MLQITVLNVMITLYYSRVNVSQNAQDTIMMMMENAKIAKMMIARNVLKTMMNVKNVNSLKYFLTENVLMNVKMDG